MLGSKNYLSPRACCRESCHHTLEAGSRPPALSPRGRLRVRLLSRTETGCWLDLLLHTSGEWQTSQYLRTYGITQVDQPSHTRGRQQVSLRSRRDWLWARLLSHKETSCRLDCRCMLEAWYWRSTYFVLMICLRLNLIRGCMGTVCRHDRVNNSLSVGTIKFKRSQWHRRRRGERYRAGPWLGRGRALHPPRRATPTFVPDTDQT